MQSLANEGDKRNTNCLNYVRLKVTRKLKQRSKANEGDVRALQVLKLQEHPGRFITVVQILLNMVAILGGEFAKVR